MKKRVLFVDDEPRVLQGLQRMLHPMRKEWEMHFVESGQQALELLSKHDFDVIVSDMRMPGMTGADLLEEVKKRYPRVVRFILSGHSDHDLILKSVGCAHQYLTKPCDADVLRRAVKRAFSLRDLMSNEKLKALVGRLSTLPSLPSIYLELMQELKRSDTTIRRVGQIVSKDVGMTAKILQLVNSAFFALPRHVTDPVQAATLLGIDTIRALVLSVHIFSQYASAKGRKVSIERLWRHSLSVGSCAKRIAQIENSGAKGIDDAFIAGLLHDLGKLVLLTCLGEEYAEVVDIATRERRSHHQVEIEKFGASHAHVGGYLLGLWGFPDPLVEAVAFHHNPGECLAEGFTSLVAVHVADGLVNCGEGEVSDYIDKEFIESAGLSEKVKQWHQAWLKQLVSIEEDERETQREGALR